MEHWSHNRLWLYDSPASVEAVIPNDLRSQFVLYGVRALPVQFTKAGPQFLDLACENTAPIPPTFLRLGYDIVQWHGHGWECSPLSCNGATGECGANRFCLLASFEHAIQAADAFARSDGLRAEPGPYVLLELWAERVPTAPA